MRSVIFGFFSVFIALMAFAQGDRGTITGTISDPAGAVVPNAPVQAKNTATGVTYSAASSSTGNYTIVQLPAGPYEVSVSVPGFKKYVRSGLTVVVAQTLRIDVGLEVGSATESVNVTAEAPLLQTESGDMSHNVASERLDDLPVLGIGAGQAGSSGIRNPDAVLTLIPGNYYAANSQVRVNGAPANTQSLRIEGQDASNTNVPGVAQQTQPSVDSIQEITIQTSNFAAEYGQVGGGFFNMTMKSGTNQLHGTAYDYFVNEVLNAGNPFTNNGLGELVRPRQRRNDYGFTLGGPVYIPKIYNGHDKTFFFFNFEQFRETQDISTNAITVPTQAYRSGNFQAAEISSAIIGTDPLGRPILQNEIYDPATTRTVNGQVIRDPFPNNTIPMSRMDPVALKIQSLIPLPTGPGLTNNYLPSYLSTRVTSIPSVKIDQALGNNQHLSFYWTRTSTESPISPTYGASDGLPAPITAAIGTFVVAHIYRLNYDNTLSPTVLFHFGVGYQDSNFFVPSVNPDGSIANNYNAVQQLGLTGATVNEFFPVFTGLCSTPCAGAGGMKNIGSSAYSKDDMQKPSANTSLTWVKNNHTYKFGGEMRLEGYPATSYAYTGGQYNFSYAETSLPYLNGQTLQGVTPGFGYASFLLGQVDNGNIAYPIADRLGKKQLGFFAQDSWKVTHKFTLDYGLRYDYSTYLQEEHGRFAFFSPTALNPSAGDLPGAVVFDGNGPGHCNCNLAKNYPFAFGPRLGAAYQITPKTVFRGGIGIIYSGTPDNNNYAGSTSSVSPFAGPGFGLPATTLQAGIPPQDAPVPWPNLNPGQYPLPGQIAATLPVPGIDQNAGRPGRQVEWSVGIQREVIPNLMVEASYVGNRGAWWDAPGLLNVNAVTPQILAAHGLSLNNPTDLQLLSSNINSPLAQSMGFSTPPYPGFPSSATVAQSLRPFPQFGNVNYWWSPLGDTWYDSLQMKATKRYSHGLTFISTFTWQKELTLGSETNPNPGTTGNAVFNDVYNRQNNKYISLYDQPYVFNISATYIIPRLPGNKAVSWALRDWTFGTFLQYASGLPIEAPLANNNLSQALFQTTFADRVPGVPLYTTNLNCHCYNPQTTFVLNPAAWTNPPAGQFGTAAAYYNDYRYPRHPVENMNLGRTFRVRERASLNIRMEFTNVFNRTVINNPSATNFQATQIRNANGTTASGFGYINVTTAASGPAVATPISLAPRSGMLVARFTF